MIFSFEKKKYLPIASIAKGVAVTGVPNTSLKPAATPAIKKTFCLGFVPCGTTVPVRWRYHPAFERPFLRDQASRRPNGSAWSRHTPAAPSASVFRWRLHGWNLSPDCCQPPPRALASGTSRLLGHRKEAGTTTTRSDSRNGVSPHPTTREIPRKRNPLPIPAESPRSPTSEGGGADGPHRPESGRNQNHSGSETIASWCAATSEIGPLLAQKHSLSTQPQQ